MQGAIGRGLTAFGLCLWLVTACSAPSPTPAASEAVPSTTPSTDEAATSCVGPGYSISHPPGWFVQPADDDRGAPACSLFAAQPFAGQPEPDWGWTGAQVVLGMKIGCRGSFELVASEEEFAIQGFPAWRRQLEAGEGPDAPAPFAYEYFVNLSPGEPCEAGRWFYARTESDDPGNFEENQRVLDKMMASIRFDDTE